MGDQRIVNPSTWDRNPVGPPYQFSTVADAPASNTVRPGFESQNWYQFPGKAHGERADLYTAVKAR